LLLWAGGTGAQAQSSGNTIDLSDANPASSGAGWTYANDVYTIENGAVITVTGSNSGSRRCIAVTADAAATVTLNGVTIDAGNNCAFAMGNAKVYLTLAGANRLKSGGENAGLRVADNGDLTINGPGSLEATGGANGSAGIGSNGREVDCKNRKITINGGAIIATAGGISGDYYNGGGAGIGNGSMGESGDNSPSLNSGTIIINGGTVTATGAGAGAGIGGGGQKTQGCGPIIINGGMITANATNGAAIGAGNHNRNPTIKSAIATITINGGTIIATVNGHMNPPAIGSDNTTTGHIYLNGGSIKMSNYKNIDVLATNRDNKPIYLNTLTVGRTPEKNTAITGGSIGSMLCDPASPPAPGKYGIRDVATDTAGKVYFWLPETAGDELVTLQANSGIYLNSYRRTADNDNAATLILKYDLTLNPAGEQVFPAETYSYLSAPAAHTVTVSNHGPEETGELTVALSGANAAAFTLPETSIATIATGGTASFTVAPVTGLTAGTYAATVTLSSKADSLLSSSFGVRFTVHKKGISITGGTIGAKIYDGATAATVTDLTFSGLENSETLTINTDYTVSAAFTDANAGSGKTVQMTVTLESAPTANNYNLTNGTDYNLAGQSISAATVSVAWGNPSFTYNGSVQVPAASITGVGNDGIITLTVNGGETNIGDHTATAVAPANYTLTNPTKAFSITAAEVAVVWGTTSFIYNGSEQIPSSTATGVGNDGNIPLTVTGGKTDAGTGYTASASMTSDNTNYTLTNTSTLFEITPAPQAITFEPVTAWKVQDGDYLLTASVSSGLPVKFRTDNTALAEISGSVLAPKQAGTITVTAYVDATDNNYLPAADAPRIITLSNNSTAVTGISVTGAEQQDGVWVVDCNITAPAVTVKIETEDASGTVEYRGVPGKTLTVDVSRPGVYSEPYTVIAPDGTRRDTSFRLEKRLAYKQVVIQRWNNTLLINNNPATNGGYMFASYQWYRNGEAIAGATAQHYSAGNKATDLLGDAPYHAALTTATGEPLRTCPAQPAAMAQGNLTAYPNPLRSGNILHLEPGMDAASLEGAEVLVYSLTGKLLLRQKAAGNPVELRLHLPMGIYIVRINDRQAKILIN
jgi:hypothetical protein